MGDRPEPFSNDILQHMLETNRVLGRIEEGQKSIFVKIKENTEKLDNHISDNGAHGIKEKEEIEEKQAKRSERNWTTYLNLAIAIGTLGAFLFDAKGCINPQRVSQIHGVAHSMVSEPVAGH